METSHDDTHPALVDRLPNLGFEPAAMEAALDRYAVRDRSAADTFLTGAHAQRRAIAQEWRSAMRAQWVERHAELEILGARLAELEALGDAADPAQRRARALAALALDRPGAVEALRAAGGTLLRL